MDAWFGSTHSFLEGWWIRPSKPFLLHAGLMRKLLFWTAPLGKHLRIYMTWCCTVNLWRSAGQSARHGQFSQMVPLNLKPITQRLWVVFSSAQVVWHWNALATGWMKPSWVSWSLSPNTLYMNSKCCPCYLPHRPGVASYLDHQSYIFWITMQQDQHTSKVSELQHLQEASPKNSYVWKAPWKSFPGSGECQATATYQMDRRDLISAILF